MDVVFLIPVSRELAGAPGFSVPVPAWEPVTVDDEAGEALIAAGYAIDVANYDPPPDPPPPLPPPELLA